MKITPRRAFNKLDEHYLIPILWCFITATVICIFYLVGEYFTSITSFTEYYRFDEQQIAEYKQHILFLGSIYTGLLVLYYLSMRLKYRWFYALLMIGNTVALYQLDWVL